MLDDLIEKCCKEALSEDELKELTDFCVKDKAILKETMAKLMQSGPQAAFNLRFAHDLRAAYGRMMSRGRHKDKDKNNSSRRKNTSLKSTKVDGKRVKKNSGSVSVSVHAIERLVDRWYPNMSVAKAEAYLKDTFSRATRCKEKTRRLKDEVWMNEDRVRFVIRRDGSDFIPIITTVLPKKDD